MAGNWKALAWAAAVSTAALLAACDNGPSAVGGKQAAGAQMASAQAPASSSAQGDMADKVDHRKDPAPLLDGKPEWAASRRFSADDRAHQAFERNGEAFGAKSFEDYVRKAHAFVEHPPKDVETLTRPNGDTLYYDAKDNVFAVADKSGLPRTMFKPDDGAAYWQQQKDREAKRQTAQSERKSHKAGGDDEA